MCAIDNYLRFPSRSFGPGAKGGNAVCPDGAMCRLAARLQLPELAENAKCHIVVFCHGFTSSKEWPVFDMLADSLLNEGIGVFRFDFNGHGESDGKFEDMTVPGEIEDTLSAVSFVGKLRHTQDISLLGHSQGGVVAAMTAGILGADKIRSLVLMAPAAVLKDDAARGNTMGALYDPYHLPEYVELPSGHRLGRAYIQTAVSLPIYETAANYGGPAMILHGLEDTLVPYAYGEHFAEVMPDAAIELIPAENHNFTFDTEYSVSVAVKWLSSQLKQNDELMAAARKPARKVRYVPDVKIRVDDHYPEMYTEFPDVSFPRDQKVVIDVIVNRLGIVTKAVVGDGTTVRDEDVLYVCKMAALKIDFSFNPDAPDRMAGKVTYSYITE